MFGCYWERVSGFGGSFDEIIANNFSDSSQVVTILATDIGFHSDDCGQWNQVLGPVTPGLDAPFSDGMYIVGTDINSGTWRADGGESCYWARLAGFTHEFGEIIANDFGGSQTIVTIGAGDRGFETEDCGTWTKIG